MKNNLDYESIGRRIREARIAQNLTQEKFAEMADITSRYLSNVENGTAKFSLPTLINITNALQLTPDRLLIDVIDKNEECLKNDYLDAIKDFDKQQLYFVIEICKVIKNSNQFPVKRKD